MILSNKILLDYVIIISNFERKMVRYNCNSEQFFLPIGDSEEASFVDKTKKIENAIGFILKQSQKNCYSYLQRWHSIRC